MLQQKQDAFHQPERQGVQPGSEWAEDFQEGRQDPEESAGEEEGALARESSQDPSGYHRRKEENTNRPHGGVCHPRPL